MSYLYLHIPFCRCKCLYCSFNSYPGLDELHHRYWRALIEEIRVCPAKRPLTTLFIGGGTPTVFDVEYLQGLYTTCEQHFGFVEGAEVGFEANPESVDYETLRRLRESGFNRISIGVQSFDDNELKTLGRIHDVATAEKAVTDARKAGFDNLSLDLMYGLPGQTCESWRQTLQRAMALGPDHVSAYQLSIEAGTAFKTLVDRGDLTLPAEDLQLDMDEITIQSTEQDGFQHYEISNFAKPGHECRHNLNYWYNEEYLACGAGAVSYLDGVRERRVDDPRRYCEAVEQGESVIVEREKLSDLASFKETVVMGLRLVEGISAERLKDRYGMSLEEVYGETLEFLITKGLVNYNGNRLVLTAVGSRIANLVMSELV